MSHAQTEPERPFVAEKKTPEAFAEKKLAEGTPKEEKILRQELSKWEGEGGRVKPREPNSQPEQDKPQVRLAPSAGEEVTHLAHEGTPLEKGELKKEIKKEEPQLPKREYKEKRAEEIQLPQKGETTPVKKESTQWVKKEAATPQREVLETDVETINRLPVVEEVVIPQKREEIQPVIYRDVEKTEIREVVQPYHQKTEKPAQVEEITLPSKFGEEIREDDTEAKKQLEEIRGKFKSGVERTEVKVEKVEKSPIVIEKEKLRIVEEIQPVIHKETIERHIIKETQPIFERVVEKPVIKSELRPVKEITKDTDIQP